MRARRLAVAAALVAPPLAAGPAAADTAVKIEFAGELRPGCVEHCSDAELSGPATVAGTTGVASGGFAATAYEYGWPVLCTGFAQATGTFSVAGITGNIRWYRSANGLAITLWNVNGGGLAGGSGHGTAVLVADPVAVSEATCATGSTPPSFRVVAELVVTD